MTELVCSVTNCYHNKNRLCCLNGIKVDGAMAEMSDGTACASFKDKGSDSYSNACKCEEEPKKALAIECEAKKCTYNEDCRCMANAIDVRGDNAESSRDTRCETFRL